MNILSIGNSFSTDAQRYLHGIAAADGFSLTSVNLYIGGCSLSQHYENMQSGERAYELEMNGESMRAKISIKEALDSREWDVVTLQQASHESPFADRYQPYISELAAYVRVNAPTARIAVHQTWAYEQGSARLHEVVGYRDHKKMYADLAAAYAKAAADIRAEVVIPSGELFQTMLDAGVEKVHRDTFHASLGLGRYALGLIWYKTLTGNDVLENPFCDFDEEVSAEQIAIAKKCVQEVAEKYKV